MLKFFIITIGFLSFLLVCQYVVAIIKAIYTMKDTRRLLIELLHSDEPLDDGLKMQMIEILSMLYKALENAPFKFMEKHIKEDIEILKQILKK